MKLFNNIIFILNILVMLALVGSYLAPYISPSVWWQIAFLGLAFPYILILNIAFAIYWLFRWDVRIWYSLILFAIGSMHIYNFIQFGAKKTSSNTNSINIVSFNAHNFATSEVSKNYDSSVFFETLRSIKPDIMCFQEFVSTGTEMDIKMFKQLFKEYKAYYKHNLDDDPTKPTGYSVSILSRYPVVKKGMVERINSDGNCTIFCDVLMPNGDTIRVINTHLKSISFQPKDFETVAELKNVDEESDIDMKGIKGVLSRLKRGFVSRSVQVDKINIFMENSPYKIIICGDFNDSPTSYSYNILKGDKKDAFVESGSGISTTYVGRMPNFRIDYILCDKSFEVYNYKPLQLNFSDHKMLSATLFY